MTLVVRPAAAGDLDDAFRWYEERQPGLGRQFLDAVEDVFLAVPETLGLYRVVYRDTRRAHVRRFPYGVFYRNVDADEVVVACFHGTRDHRRWESRR